MVKSHRCPALLLLATLLLVAGCFNQEGATPLTGPSETVRVAVEGGPGFPDLILTELTVDSYTTTSIAYSWTIKNVGSAPANCWMKNRNYCDALAT